MSDDQQTQQRSSSKSNLLEQRWIESEAMRTKESDKTIGDDQDEDADDQGDWADIFADPDPEDTFEFHFDIGNDDRAVVDITLVGYKAELGQTLHSTGLTLWRASSLLCDFMIQNQHYIRNKSVIELGAGLGLCGILATHLQASKVVLTDGDTDTLSNLRSNVERNAVVGASVRQLIWGSIPTTSISTTTTTTTNNNDKVSMSTQSDQHEIGSYDTVLGSDIIYLEEVLDPLWRTVNELLAVNGAFLLAFARRNVSLDLVLECANRFGFAWHHDDNRSEGVVVFRRR